MPPDHPTENMVLVFDAKRPAWQTALSEGKITRLFYLRWEGEHMFEIDEGGQLSSWLRLGDDQWFVVGRRVRIEHTTGAHPEPLRIWIGPPV